MDWMLMMTFCGLGGLAVAYLTIHWLLKTCAGAGWMNRGHDFHHTHKAPVPRLGGIALASAFVAAAAFTFVFHRNDFGAMRKPVAFVAGVLAMFLLGLWDDIKPLGAKRKLAGQVLIAGSMYLLGFSIAQVKVPFSSTIIHLGGWGLPVTLFWLVGLTNLINLIDGVDGLAGGICLMLMVLLAYVGYETSQLSLLMAGMAGGLVGFLCFNFPPARIYMGDGGAYMLGFLIGLTTIATSSKGTVIAALVSPLFVLALPILDTSVAILRRGLQGLPLFRPDRRHIHHRLMDSGMSRRRVVLGIYAFTLVFLILGFLAFSYRGHLVPILFGVAGLVILTCAGRLNFSREWFAVGHVLGSSLEVRQEVQYALSLSRWLELEADRAESLDDLYADFTFMLGKLGFSHARLIRNDTERVWPLEGAVLSDRQSRHVLPGQAGVLELSSHPCAEHRRERDEDATTAARTARTPDCTCVGNDKLFGILSELAAEAWTKAVRKWERRRPALAPDAVSPLVQPQRLTLKEYPLRRSSISRE